MTTTGLAASAQQTPKRPTTDANTADSRMSISTKVRIHVPSSGFQDKVAKNLELATWDPGHCPPSEDAMTRMRWLFPLPWLLVICIAAPSQNYDPPNAKPPDKPTQEAIVARSRQLGQALAVMQRQGVRDPVFSDVEIYHKAAEWIVRHNEFYSDQFGAWTVAVLDRGLLRASQALRGESPWLNQVGSASARAYRSRVDGSLQPYSVILPTEYAKEPKKWRLDVVLHGRDSSICEIKFLYQHSGDKPATEQPYVTLEIFGRGNNAYRWAGETDVLEAIDAFVATERTLGRGELLDPTRVV